MRMHAIVVRFVAAVSMLAVAGAASAQTTGTAGQAAQNGSTATPAPLPPEYVIGVNDILIVHVWEVPQVSGEVIVRPDGKITLPLAGDILARGLEPNALAKLITQVLQKENLLQQPRVTVSVKQINSRQVCVQGEIAKVGCFDLSAPMTVLTLISKAGGLLSWADKKNLTLVREEKRPDGTPWTLRINYEDLMNRKNMDQNYELKPGDILIVK